MRYAGQGWEIPVRLSDEDVADPQAKTYLQRFEADYARLFGRTVQGMQAEITVWSVNAFTTSPPVTKVQPCTAQAYRPSSDASRSYFDPALGQAVPAQLVSRHELAKGAQIQGPALVVEDETTIVLPSSRQLMALADGTIELSMKR